MGVPHLGLLQPLSQTHPPYPDIHTHTHMIHPTHCHGHTVSQTRPQTCNHIHRLTGMHSLTDTHTPTPLPTLAHTQTHSQVPSRGVGTHLKRSSSTSSSGVFRCTLRSWPFLAWIPPSRLAVPRTPVTHLSPACPRAPTVPICAEIWSRALRKKHTAAAYGPRQRPNQCQPMHHPRPPCQLHSMVLSQSGPSTTAITGHTLHVGQALYTLPSNPHHH